MTADASPYADYPHADHPLPPSGQMLVDAETDEAGCQRRNVMRCIGAENLGSNGPAWALNRCSCHRPPRNAPHGIADIISDKQRARFIESNPDRAAQRLAVIVYKTGEDIDRLPRWAAVGEPHEDNLVAAQGLAVPRSMLSTKAPPRYGSGSKLPVSKVSPSEAV
jgi:hypothetical protein